MDQFDRRYFNKTPEAPRKQWRQTSPNALVATDLEPAPIPEDACLECKGKGRRWEAYRKGRGFAQSFRTCPDCKGTGRLGDPHGH